MDNPELTNDQETADATGAGAEAWVRRHINRIMVAVVSLGFVLYLAFGTVEARIWRFGRLYFEDRNIWDVWGYLGDHLPRMPGQGIVSAFYWLSLAVMIVGVIVGLWLILGTDDDDPSREAGHAPGHAAPDA